jgi:hypothetical protein
MAWLLVLLGAAGGQRVETFQKTQYILCMGWDGDDEKLAFYDS